MQTTLDFEVLRQWIGRTESMTDRIDAGRARRMQATLDREPGFQEGDVLPPFWHYIYFNPEVPASQLKEDGHERLGRFLPPVSLKRRMWAGGRVEIDQDLQIGEICEKVSTIRDVQMKQGRSGDLCFVTVDHAFTVDGRPRITERQDIVYREMPKAGSVAPRGKPTPGGATAHITVTPDPVMLFRYSALIFYGHRIHYDLDYTREVEGYPGLVVHGPLTAALLAEFGRDQQPARRLVSFDIRAMSPLFSPAPFQLEARNDGDTTRTWARGPDGELAMTVDLTFLTNTNET
ncbi:MAG: MaoC family dehydratase N-terminal domain-containing protein [Pseudomonadota bacterium]